MSTRQASVPTHPGTPRPVKPSWRLTAMIWPHTKVRRSIRMAETLSCSRDVSAPACFLQPSSGCGLKQSTGFQRVFGVHETGYNEISHWGLRHPHGPPQEGLPSGHPSKELHDTRHGPGNLIPFLSTAIISSYSSAFKEFT